MSKRLFKVPFVLKGECFVWAENEDDAIDEVEFAASTDVAESHYDSHQLTIEEDEVEQVSGLPASARAI